MTSSALHTGPAVQTWRDQRERRFHLERDEALRVLSDISAVLPELRYYSGVDTTFVVTTYLDTPDGEYVARCSGQGHSIKVRVREYMHLDVDGNYHHEPVCYLERKERRGEVRIKQRIRLDKSDIASIVAGKLSLATDSTEGLALTKEMSPRYLVPVMVSAYWRRVWGIDGDLRITFDERLGYYNPRGLYEHHPALSPEVLGSPAAKGPARILEIKEPTHPSSAAWLEPLVAHLPMPADDYSKFRDGIRAISDCDGESVPLTKPVIFRR